MRVSRQFIFFFLMKRLIHANKTLSTYALKTQGYLYTFYTFFKDLRTIIKNKVPKERLFTCRLSI